MALWTVGVPLAAQPIKLIGSEPAGYSATFSPDASITLTFSATIDSVAVGAVRVLGYHSGVHRGSVSWGGSSIRFAPEHAFRGGERVRLAVAAGSVFPSVGSSNENSLELRFDVGTQPGPIGFVRSRVQEIPLVHQLPARPSGAAAMTVGDFTGDGNPDVFMPVVGAFPGYRLGPMIWLGFLRLWKLVLRRDS